MEQQEVSTSVTTRSAGFRYGLIMGIISIAFFLILTLIGVDMTERYWGWIGYVIAAALIFFAHKYYKESGSGYMSYGQGIGVAFWMSLLAGLIYAVFFYIYLKFIDASFIDAIKDKQIEGFEQNGMSDEQIEQTMKFSNMFLIPEAMLGLTFIGTIIQDVIIGLIVTIFTQRKQPETF